MEQNPSFKYTNMKNRNIYQDSLVQSFSIGNT